MLKVIGCFRRALFRNVLLVSGIKAEKKMCIKEAAAERICKQNKTINSPIGWKVTAVQTSLKPMICPGCLMGDCTVVCNLEKHIKQRLSDFISKFTFFTSLHTLNRTIRMFWLYEPSSFFYFLFALQIHCAPPQNVLAASQAPLPTISIFKLYKV